MDELLELSAVDLAARVRDRRVSPTEFVDAHLARIDEVNGALNAVIEPFHARAKARAAEQTEQLARRSVRADDLPPLFGVPCTIKECFAVAGARWTGGMTSRRDVRAERSATAVERLLAAGAIPLGTTNVPEAAMWHESTNLLYGRSSNPHDTRCTPGGSSGGEAAIIGAGGSPFGIGSDVGGSIRMPASFCGIAGHKPSPGLVPGTGHCPEMDGEVSRYAVAGPLARRASDLPLLLEVLSGPDGIDPSITGAFSRAALADLPALPARAYYYEDGRFRSQPAVRGAVRNAVRALADLGVPVEPFRPKLIDRGLEIWLATLDLAKHDHFPQGFVQVLGDGKAIHPFREMARLALGAPRHTFPSLMLACGEQLARLLPRGGIARLAELRFTLRREIEERLGRDAVLLAPAFPSTAPRHNAPLLRPFDWISTGIVNVLELPATCVPANRDRKDLPAGVQVIAAGGHDALTLKVAGVLERELGGWRRGRSPFAV